MVHPTIEKPLEIKAFSWVGYFCEDSRQEGLFIFCGIFATHPALAPAPISPAHRQPAAPKMTRSAGKTGLASPENRPAAALHKLFTFNHDFILHLLLTSKCKIPIMGLSESDREPRFFIELRHGKHELLKGA